RGFRRPEAGRRRRAARRGRRVVGGRPAGRGRGVQRSQRRPDALVSPLARVRGLLRRPGRRPAPDPAVVVHARAGPPLEADGGELRARPARARAARELGLPRIPVRHRVRHRAGPRQDPPRRLHEAPGHNRGLLQAVRRVSPRPDHPDILTVGCVLHSAISTASRSSNMESASGRVIETNGAALRIAEGGTGEPALVFLHYWGGSARTWQRVLHWLGEQVPWGAINQRGWGGSVATDGRYALADMADDVERVVRTLDLRRYVLVGHSMGGKVAQIVAKRQPPGLARLVLVAADADAGPRGPARRHAGLLWL